MPFLVARLCAIIAKHDVPGRVMRPVYVSMWRCSERFQRLNLLDLDESEVDNDITCAQCFFGVLAVDEAKYDLGPTPSHFHEGFSM